MNRSVPPALRPQAVLRVESATWLNAHLVRIVAGGADFSLLSPNNATDKYVKLYFARPDLALTAPYDLKALADVLPAADVPVRRTYTVRWMDPAAQRLAIDFVVHGDDGVAGPWAARARPGDALVVSGPNGSWRPDPTADWYLFAGDEAALPAIAAGLEVLPGHSTGHVFLEVAQASDAVELSAPAGVVVHWVVRGEREAGSTRLLADAVSALDWPAGRVEAFVHGERGAMKALRDVLFTSRGLERSQVSLSGYWAHGRSEGRFQAEKREPIGQILP